MANFSASGQPGQANNAGDAYANLPKIWQAEVLATFDQEALALKLFAKRMISGGKSAAFRVIGQGSAKHHVWGENVIETGNGYTSDVKHNIVEVFIDRPLVAVENMDDQEFMMLNNSDALRMEITRELGRTLARTYDKYALQKAVMAAREAATITSGPTGGAITDADAKTNAASLIDSILTAAKNMDVDNIPEMDRYVFIHPNEYKILRADLVNNPGFFHFDKDIGSRGSFADGVVGDIGGIKVVKTNHVPQTDLSSAITGDLNDYSDNFSTTVCVVAHKEAIGQVVLDGVKLHVLDKPEYLGKSVITHLMAGINTLRPEAAVEIKTA